MKTSFIKKNIHELIIFTYLYIYMNKSKNNKFDKILKNKIDILFLFNINK
jgi:hypothetical protein